MESIEAVIKKIHSLKIVYYIWWAWIICPFLVRTESASRLIPREGGNSCVPVKMLWWLASGFPPHRQSSSNARYCCSSLSWAATSTSIHTCILPAVLMICASKWNDGYLEHISLGKNPKIQNKQTNKHIKPQEQMQFCDGAMSAASHGGLSVKPKLDYQLVIRNRLSNG